MFIDGVEVEAAGEREGDREELLRPLAAKVTLALALALGLLSVVVVLMVVPVVVLLLAEGRGLARALRAGDWKAPSEELPLLEPTQPTPPTPVAAAPVAATPLPPLSSPPILQLVAVTAVVVTALLVLENGLLALKGLVIKTPTDSGRSPEVAPVPWLASPCLW